MYFLNLVQNCYVPYVCKKCSCGLKGFPPKMGCELVIKNDFIITFLQIWRHFPHIFECCLWLEIKHCPDTRGSHLAAGFQSCPLWRKQAYPASALCIVVAHRKQKMECLLVKINGRLLVLLCSFALCMTEVSLPSKAVLGMTAEWTMFVPEPLPAGSVPWISLLCLSLHWHWVGHTSLLTEDLKL